MKLKLLILVAILGSFVSKAIGSGEVLIIEKNIDSICMGDLYATFSYEISGFEGDGPEYSLVVMFMPPTQNDFNVTIPAESAGDFKLTIPAELGLETYIADVTLIVGTTEANSVAISIVVLELPYAGEDTILKICGDDSITKEDLFKALGPGIDTAGSSWEPEPPIEGAVEPDLYKYKVKSKCGEDSAIVRVTNLCFSLHNDSDTVCSGDMASYKYSVLTGEPELILIVLSYTEKSLLLKDTIYVDPNNIPSDSIITFEVPESIDGGIHHANINAKKDSISSNVVFIETVIPSPPNAGQGDTLIICEGDSVTNADLFGALRGEPDQDMYEDSDDDGRYWIEQMNGVGIYHYVVVDKSGCKYDPDISIVVVTEQTKPNAGKDGYLLICEDDIITDSILFDKLGGNRDPDLIEDSDKDGRYWVEGMGGGTYYYVVEDTSSCNYQNDTSSVDVTVVNRPFAGNNDTIFICEGETISIDTLFKYLVEEDLGDWDTDAKLVGAGFYNYIVSAPPCLNDTSSITIIETSPAEMDFLVAKPIGNESVLIFPTIVTIEDIVVTDDGVTKPVLWSEGYFYIDSMYRAAGTVFTITFNINGGCSGVTEYVYPDNTVSAYSIQSNKEDSYKFYPNPARTQIIIEMNPNLRSAHDAFQTRIYSLAGTCVLEAVIDGHSESLNIESLTPGVYFLQISGSEVVFEPKKLIISK